MPDTREANPEAATEPRSDRPSIRPTTRDRRAEAPRWARPLAIAIVALLVLALAVAWVQDRNGDYPGHRAPASLRGLKGLVMPPTNSEVDLFDRAGPVRSVGPWPWRAASGPIWLTDDGLARAGATGGAITVDPGRPDVVVQADAFLPAPRAGLVFRWKDEADHFSVEVSADRGAWVLVRTQGGRRTELTRILAVTAGSNVGVTLTADRILVAVDGQPRYERVDRTFADATAVGLQAPDHGTRFDAFAVLAG